MEIQQHDVKRLHDALLWIISFRKLMPSLLPSDDTAPSNGAHVCAIGTAIMVNSLPRGPNNPNDIVLSRILLPNYIMAVSFDDIVVLLLPFATQWGEQ